MPVYEYRCEECGRAFEMTATFAAYEEGLDPVCPKCASKTAQRVLGRPMVMTASKSDSADSGGDGCDTGEGDMSGVDDYLDGVV